MPKLPLRVLFVCGVLLAACASLSQAAGQSAPVLRIDGLGKGAAPLDGPWQFHLGDNPAWAAPGTADATGTNGWEQLSADEPWGAQGHAGYVGYAWYRKHLSLRPAPGAPPDFAMLILHIDDAYEMYWNGRLIARNGGMPPHSLTYFVQPPQTFGLGPVREGVLALRVWKGPLASFDSDRIGGMYAAPIVGSPAAIAGLKAENDYAWMRRNQYNFGIVSLDALVMLLALLAWWRNRSQRVLLWIAMFCFTPTMGTVLAGLRIPFTFSFAIGWLQPVLTIQDIGLWFLLLELLNLVENRRLAKFTRVLAIVIFISSSLDGLLNVFDWSNPHWSTWFQGADAALTVIYTLTGIYPILLVSFALRKRLDSARWLVAIMAFLTDMIRTVRIAAAQGDRFTHWTLTQRLGEPLFSINGNTFNAETIADSLLLIAIVYAVYRYVQEAMRHQGALEQEMKSARELQQVLIPETLPELPGYAISSVYRPAAEVGGDFFQIIPLEGERAGCTLIVLGDVSGKGLRAAMTVSLIVGTVRTLARYVSSPAALLAELNQRLYGRMQGGFVTSLAVLLEGEGKCSLASAGHPAPFLNQHAVELPGALPLGVVPEVSYSEAQLALRPGDHFALYTDGLLEARNAEGEIFSFERLDTLLRARPDAAEATQAAVHFGQEDDITVLTLTRLAGGQQGSTQLSVPGLETA